MFLSRVTHLSQGCTFKLETTLQDLIPLIMYLILSKALWKLKISKIHHKTELKSDKILNKSPINQITRKISHKLNRLHPRNILAVINLIFLIKFRKYNKIKNLTQAKAHLKECYQEWNEDIYYYYLSL